MTGLNPLTSLTSTQSCKIEELKVAHAQQPATGFRIPQTFREENRTDVDLCEEISVDSSVEVQVRVECWVHPLCHPVELPWTHGKIERCLTCGQLLEDVVTDLRPNIPSKSHKIEIVHWDSKWYSHNNRRLWLFKEEVVIAVQVHVGSTDRASLRSLTACTDGLSVIFFPRGVCKACGDKFVIHRSCTTTIVRGRLTLLRHRLKLVRF